MTRKQAVAEVCHQLGVDPDRAERMIHDRWADPDYPAFDGYRDIVNSLIDQAETKPIDRAWEARNHDPFEWV